MADARVIRLDDERPRGGRRSPTGADAVAAGAARAGGERARRQRRTTPLLDGAGDPVTEPSVPTGQPPAAQQPAPSAPPEPPAVATTARQQPARRKAAKKTTRPPRPRPVAAASEQPPTIAQERVERVRREADEVGRLLAEELSEAPSSGELEEQLARALAFVRRRLTGDYTVDEFGFDAELTDTVLMAMLRPLYKRWFRVEVRGIENIPDTGGALIVANHSGTVPLDSMMTMVAVHDEHPQHRHLRMLGADLVFSTPVIGEYARKTGSTLATNADAEKLLSSGHLVGVWPEGFKGVGKHFSERYKLQRFGRGGFVSAALRTRTPIVPCAIVGAEEIYPIIGSMPTLARLLGVPYVPITPTFPWLGPLGMVPLPTKWLIEFGEPVPTDDHGDGAAEDPMLVFDITDQVRETIQQTLYSLLVQRRSVFF
jgi:1-acyl-sn-glycerol-3-phosphate acyltransferase